MVKDLTRLLPPRLALWIQRLDLFSRPVAAFLGLLAAAGLLVLYLVNPAESGRFPFCPILYLTGFYCPGCGSLRGIHQLLHGHLFAAFDLNPLMVVALPFLLYGIASYGARAFLGRRLPTVFLPPWVLWSILAVIMIYAVFRNLPFAPFTFLAP